MGDKHKERVNLGKVTTRVCDLRRSLVWGFAVKPWEVQADVCEIQEPEAGTGEKCCGSEPWGAKGWCCWCPGPGCTFLLWPAPMFAGLGKESELKAALFWPFIFTNLSSSSWLEKWTKSWGQKFLMASQTASTSSPWCQVRDGHGTCHQVNKEASFPA